MKSWFRRLAGLLVGYCIISCGGIRNQASPSSLIRHLGSSTVALVIQLPDDNKIESHVYCAGVWVGSNAILTAYHCVEAAAEKRSEHEQGNDEKLHVKGAAINFILENEVVGVAEDPTTIHLGHVYDIDPDHDLALVRAEGNIIPHDVVRLAPHLPALGDKVFVVGHPSGLYWSYVRGTLSSVRDHMPIDKKGAFLQISSAIWKGNSGGGAFDEYGDLIGIASFMTKAPNIGFFVHLDGIRHFLIANKLLVK